MKLRNKKTGEIAEPFGITCMDGRTFIRFDDGKGTFKFEAHSLAELNAEWEDYEEPKRHWIIDTMNDRVKDFDVPMTFNESIGNYFETKEEAEKAVEKLKAWKRLKDKRFSFEGYDDGYKHDFNSGHIEFYVENDGGVLKDLDLLFEGEV